MRKIITYTVMGLLFLLCGCTNPGAGRPTPGYPSTSELKNSQTTLPGDEEELFLSDAQEVGEELFLVVSVDTDAESIRLYRYTTQREYRFFYSADTLFSDKYGNHSSVGRFTPGKVVHIGTLDVDRRLSSVQMASEVWEYDKISRFSVDEALGALTIGDTKYRYGEDSFVFSMGERITMADLKDNDVLTVVGKDKQILSVVVTTGQGMLALTNTELFEGSILQLGTGIFQVITKDMELEVPEGDYVLAVANNGWGGNCDITINRGETTVVDLDSIKGEGPKFGEIRFVIDAVDATLVIDGQIVDYSEPVRLQYGRHSVTVSSEKYDGFSKYLYVNSEEATIAFGIVKEEETEEEESSEKESEKNTETGSETESEAESQKETQTDNSENSGNNRLTDEQLAEYLTTLRELLGSM